MRIALTGEARSGKDTVAKLLGEDFKRYAFGDYMKESYFKKYPERKETPKDREHMIAFSQPIVDIHPNVWVNMLELDLNWYDAEYCFDGDFVITDLRQPHEEEWCRENGFHIVRVHSCEQRRLNRATRLGEKLGIDLPYKVNADFHIYNDGSLEDLQKSCNKLLQVLHTYDKMKSVTQEANRSYAKGSNYFN